MLSKNEGFTNMTDKIVMTPEEIREFLLKRYRKSNSTKPVYGDWSSWSKCQSNIPNKQCGPGFRERTRTCMYGECDKTLLSQRLDCNLGSCPTAMSQQDYLLLKNATIPFYKASLDYLSDKINIDAYGVEFNKHNNFMKKNKSRFEQYPNDIALAAHKQLEKDIAPDVIKVMANAFIKMFAKSMTKK